MHDSSEGLRSIIGRKLIEQVDPFEETALVEHCKNPDQLAEVAPRMTKTNWNATRGHMLPLSKLN